MLLLDPKNEFDKNFGELYLKGYFSEDQYIIGRDYFNLRYRLDGVSPLCHKSPDDFSEIDDTLHLAERQAEALIEYLNKIPIE